MNFVTLTAAAGQANTPAGLLATFGPIVVIFVIFYFMLIRPQRKREKETQQMRSNIEVGDEIITIGGIIGTVVSLRDDTLIVETGSDRNKIRVARWAVQQNNTAKEVQ